MEIESKTNNTQEEKKQHIDPYTVQLMIMRSEMYIVYNYPDLVSINQKLINEKVDNLIPDNSCVFIIKSFTEEDIHKAIKYKIWSSTNFGNSKLNNEFKAGKKVFLLFSTFKANQFIGLAEMKSEVNFKNVFPLWARDNWKSTFEIEWVLIKDVHFREFRNVSCEKREKGVNGEYNFINYSSKSLTNSPDCQLVPLNEAKEIIQVMIDFQNRNSILEHFEYYDRRQANYETFLKNNSMNSLEGKKQFNPYFNNNKQIIK